MSDQTVLDSLHGIDFFHDIADEHLERLAALVTPVEFPPHHIIFREEEKAKDAYLIISGQVSLISCNPDVGCRELTTVSDGHLIGWSPLLGRRLLSDTARTVTATKALAVDGEQVLALCREYPDFGFQFMHRVAQVLADRLFATRMQHLRMSGHQLPTVQIESD
jgi:CRP-like cAMP-binding protein